MYKDRDKQKEANRQAQARRRQQGMTKGMTSEGMTQQGMTALANRPMAVNLELCRTCGEPLPALEQPRQYPGRCIDCIKASYA